MTILGDNCWGSLLADVACQPADQGWRPGRASPFFAHFCAGCQQNGIVIPAARVAIPRPTNSPLLLQNATSNGPWSKRQGLPRYRTANSTARCTGPRAVIFESPPAACVGGEPARLSSDPSCCSAVRRVLGQDQEPGWPLAVVEATMAAACAEPDVALLFDPPPTEWIFVASGGISSVRFVLSHETLVPVAGGGPLAVSCHQPLPLPSGACRATDMPATLAFPGSLTALSASCAAAGAATAVRSDGATGPPPGGGGGRNLSCSSSRRRHRSRCSRSRRPPTSLRHRPPGSTSAEPAKSSMRRRPSLPRAATDHLLVAHSGCYLARRHVARPSARSPRVCRAPRRCECCSPCTAVLVRPGCLASRRGRCAIPAEASLGFDGTSRCRNRAGPSPGLPAPYICQRLCQCQCQC